MLRVSTRQLNLRNAQALQEFLGNVRKPIARAAASGARSIGLPNPSVPIRREGPIGFFSSLPQRLRVYLAPGTRLEPDGDAMHNTADLGALWGEVGAIDENKIDIAGESLMRMRRQYEKPPVMG